MSLPNPTKASTRLLALDVFRGWTIAFMIIVNTPGNGDRSWSPLQHARWHGFTPTDLVFPSFLFIIGVSAWFSLKKFHHTWSNSALIRIWKRTAVLFLIGMLMWYVPSLIVSVFNGEVGMFFSNLIANVRILGVLGRLALCYGIGCTLALRFSTRGLIGFSACALLLYWALMRFFGTGADPYSLQTNAALRFDLWLLGPAHLYHGETVDGVPFAFDPEGVLSTLPSIVTFIIGYLTGGFLGRQPDRRYALSELFPAAFLLIAAGLLWDYWLGFPINKKLWTSSYTLYVGGLSLFVLCMAVWLIDIRGKAGWFKFFNIFGMNPLVAYITSEMGVTVLSTFMIPTPGGKSESGFEWLYHHTGAAMFGDNGIGSFAFSLGYMLCCWIVSWFFFRRGWTIKA